MNNIYKIEAYCEASIKQLADFIEKSGGRFVIRGWAVITDHVFTETETNQALHLVARISDHLTDDDLYYWSINNSKQAA